jgi:hypothetical protein
MDGFDPASLWDFSHPISLDYIPDNDFIALLQKQYPPITALDPNSIYHHPDNSNNNSRVSPLPALTPPSEDSSPSPPTITDSSNPPSRKTSSSHQHQHQHRSESGDDSALKRKASDDSLNDEAPSLKKNPHLESNGDNGNQDLSNNNTSAADGVIKKGGSNSRRKGSEASSPVRNTLSLSPIIKPSSLASFFFSPPIKHTQLVFHLPPSLSIRYPR